MKQKRHRGVSSTAIVACVLGVVVLYLLYNVYNEGGMNRFFSDSTERVTPRVVEARGALSDSENSLIELF